MNGESTVGSSWSDAAGATVGVVVAVVVVVVVVV